MALMTAQEYFASFPAAQQAEIRASWNGQDMLQAWYQNALTANSVPQKGGTTPPAPGKGGLDFPTFLRGLAKTQGWSEDFERFSDDQLRAWEPSFDYKANRFRSEHDQFAGQGAVFEKPTDLPAGYSFHGNSVVLTKDLPWWAEGSEQAPPGGGAGGAAGGAGTAAPGITTDPLQAALMDLFASRQGIFGELTGGGPTARETAPDLQGLSLPGGGLWWGQPEGVGFEGFAGQPAAAAAPARPRQPQQVSGPVGAGQVTLPPGEGPWQELPTGSRPPLPEMLPGANTQRSPLAAALLELYPKGTGGGKWWQQ
jgi:hypothetical protein